MLTHSTVSICRKLLVKELEEIDRLIEHAEYNKTVWSVYPANLIDKFDRKMFLRFCTQATKLRAKKTKIENSIRELKAWSWTGNPKELPCEK